MSYQSVDALQKALATNIFSNRQDTKKAAGRSLGTIVELITFYVLRGWNLQQFLSIERGLAEFANDEITHNVEFGLHPIVQSESIQLNKVDVNLPITSAKIAKQLRMPLEVPLRANQLLTSDHILRNACLISESKDSFLIANLTASFNQQWNIDVTKLRNAPFAMVECKRVGVEDGARKGPTTIEKAKQGAYVAKHVSSLQKVRGHDGKLYGIMPQMDGSFDIQSLESEINRLIFYAPAEQLQGFILTVGVVSNHGNWFTKDSPNKELLVLQQSYDWLLFLTDAAIAEFVQDTILSNMSEMAPVKKAFQDSYASGKSGNNRFTKVKIDFNAHLVLEDYFEKHIERIEKTWFNLLAPRNGTLEDLKKQLFSLALRVKR